MRVCELATYQGWQSDMVHTLLGHSITKFILALAPPAQNYIDRIQWYGDGTKAFYAKEVYHKFTIVVQEVMTNF